MRAREGEMVEEPKPAKKLAPASAPAPVKFRNWFPFWFRLQQMVFQASVTQENGRLRSLLPFYIPNSATFIRLRQIYQSKVFKGGVFYTSPWVRYGPLVNIFVKVIYVLEKQNLKVTPKHRLLDHDVKQIVIRCLNNKNEDLADKLK